MRIKTYAEIRQFCIDERLKGTLMPEIVKALAAMGVDGWSYDRVKNVTRACRNPDMPLTDKPRKSAELKEKEGSTERKPKVERTESGYLIRYGKNKQIAATTEQIEHAFQLFCIAGLTMNAVALQMGWSRAEYFAIKTAFEITHDSIPFLPETIDALTTDELAERMRIAKKRYALQKLHSTKFADIETEVKRLHKAEFWADEFASKINAIDPKPYEIKPIKHGDTEYMLIATDFHAGLEVSNFLGDYSIDVMKKRFVDVTEQIVSKLKPCRLTIALLGDDVHAPPHDSCGKQSLNAVDSIFHLVESLSSMFLTLVLRGFRLRIAHTPGNHDYINRGSARVNEESFARFTAWGLRCKFEHFAQIEFIETVNHMALIPFFEYNVLALHGHQTKKLSNFDKLLRKHNLLEIVAGHYHCYRVESMDNVPVYYNNAFCSGDEYAANLGLGSEPGCRLIEYGKKGRISDTLIRFDC